MKGTSSLYLKAIQEKLNEETQDPSQQILSGWSGGSGESSHCSKSVENNFCFFAGYLGLSSFVVVILPSHMTHV